MIHREAIFCLKFRLDTLVIGSPQDFHSYTKHVSAGENRPLEMSLLVAGGLRFENLCRVVLIQCEGFSAGSVRDGVYYVSLENGFVGGSLGRNVVGSLGFLGLQNGVGICFDEPILRHIVLPSNYFPICGIGV